MLERARAALGEVPQCRVGGLGALGVERAQVQQSVGHRRYTRAAHRRAQGHVQVHQQPAGADHLYQRGQLALPTQAQTDQVAAVLQRRCHSRRSQFEAVSKVQA